MLMMLMLAGRLNARLAARPSCRRGQEPRSDPARVEIRSAE
jgi:hypothetical protein